MKTQSGKNGNKMILDNLKNTTVLITGHTGFKGSWLAIFLNLLGADVIGYALPPYTKKDNFVVTKLSKKITDINSDIRNYERLYQVFTNYKPEIVFHLAAQSLVKRSYREPKYTYDVNIGGLVNLLECCRKTDSVKVIINVTSDKCYENNNWTWGYRENDPMGGYDPYSSSKGCSELISSSYKKSFFNPAAYSYHKKSISSVRAGNVIGGGDWSNYRLVPDCIKALENKKVIDIRNPIARRPWQFVLEPLGGYLLLASKMLEEPKKYSGAWNFGPDYSSIITVKDVVKKIINNYGKGKWHSSNGESNKEHEANFLALDTSKARYHIGWQPIYNIDKAINKTVNWYKEMSKGNQNMMNVCQNQINEYIELIGKKWKS